MPGNFDHLGLTRWPFSIVPDREFCVFVADRKQLRSEILDMLANLSRRDSSSIQLFWAWFGAGKTHSLYYLAHKAAEITKQVSNNILHVVYSEFPKGARNFLDLYRSFVIGLDTEVLADAFLEVSTCKDADRLRKELMTASPDLSRALHVMVTGESQDQLIATRWLRADNLPISEFRKIGISQKISSTEEATRIMAALIDLLIVAARSIGRPGCRILWLLDEYQRIEKAGARGLDEINTGLHSTFNACPNGLSLFLSFSGKPQANSLPGWFSRELRDRIGRTKIMVLPPMLSEESLEFVKDVLTQFRAPGDEHSSPYFPFTEAACKAILEEIQKRDELKPRAIMHAFSAVLEEADRKIESGEIKVISREFANQVLSERIVFGIKEEEG